MSVSYVGPLAANTDSIIKEFGSVEAGVGGILCMCWGGSRKAFFVIKLKFTQCVFIEGFAPSLAGRIAKDHSPKYSNELDHIQQLYNKKRFANK